MSVTLQKLFHENEALFKLSLAAGQNGVGNVVSWVYMLEDETITSFFHGTELAVTTCMKSERDGDWLYTLVQRLCECDAAGLIINTGRFLFEIPRPVLDFCNAHEFPLFTMPWEIRITDLVQSFCVRIMNDQYEATLHDQAIRDVILKRDNLAECRDILGQYYDLAGRFTVFCIYIRQTAGAAEEGSSREYLLENRIRRLKRAPSAASVHVGLLKFESYLLIVLNNASAPMVQQIRDLILDVYADSVKTHDIFVGVGIEAEGLERLDQSYNRAATAMRMAMYRHEPAIRFEDMGFYKILFSVKDEEVLYAYADEILGPLDRYDAKNHSYVELLKTYIRQDRSLAGTAEALFMHRNTVNYQIQKMKELLGSPLKTLEDLFPYQVALAIRDMEGNAERGREKHERDSS